MESSSGTPHLLTDVRFTVARKGYDPDEVDNFLERVSAAVAQLQEKLRQSTADAESAEGRAADATRSQTLLQARIDKLEADLAEARQTPAPAASRGPEEEAAEVSKVLVLAQRTADAAVAEARATASHVVNEAEQEASRILVTARNEADEQATRQRTALAEEVAALESSRDQLSTDIASLNRYVEDQRASLAGALTRIQAVLQDPAALRMVKPPASAARVEAPRPAPAFEPAAAAKPETVDDIPPSASGSSTDDSAEASEERSPIQDPLLDDLNPPSTPVMVFDAEETNEAEEKFLGTQNEEADAAMRAFFEADFDDEQRFGR